MNTLPETAGFILTMLRAVASIETESLAHPLPIMITYLKVRNLAIVEEFEIEPGPGLNVLTGETGAGKSLLIDSLELLSGARGSTESIRSGAARLSAEAVFQLPSAVATDLESLGIELGVAGSSDVELIVRREIASAGRSRVMVNGSPLTVKELAATMDRMLQIHGQDQSRERIAGQTFREIVDRYGDHGTLLDQTRATHDSWRTAADQLQSLMDSQKDGALRLDLLKYQIDEISAAGLDVSEEESIRGERSILARASEIIQMTAGAYRLLDEDEESALSQLARAVHLLQPLVTIEPIRALLEELEEGRYRIQEASRTLAGLSESTRHDPARLEEIEHRLATIDRLRRKYGGTVESTLEHLESITTQYDALIGFDKNIAGLRSREEVLFAAFRKRAEELSAARTRTARALEKDIQRELQDLAMEQTVVRIAVGTLPGHDSRWVRNEQPIQFGRDGIDRVELLASTNRGEDPRPIHKIASGGELSRLQLAIASALFKHSASAAAATLVFDEIDAGIGGRVAEVVGRKLRELAESNQVICVTHLPQIASFGTDQFRVWKEDAGGRTTARIIKLTTHAERVEEIARMLGGSSVTASARAHADDLLVAARTPGPERKPRIARVASRS